MDDRAKSKGTEKSYTWSAETTDLTKESRWKTFEYSC